MEKFEELKLRIDKFTKDRNWEQFHTPVNLAKSISIEAAELLECFQWSDTEFDKEHLLEELSDVMNYCIQLSLVLDVDIVECINKKMDQNAIKYPIEKAYGSSEKYNKL